MSIPTQYLCHSLQEVWKDSLEIQLNNGALVLSPRGKQGQESYEGISKDMERQLNNLALENKDLRAPLSLFFPTNVELLVEHLNAELPTKMARIENAVTSPKEEEEAPASSPPSSPSSSPADAEGAACGGGTTRRLLNHLTTTRTRGLDLEMRFPYLFPLPKNSSLWRHRGTVKPPYMEWLSLLRQKKVEEEEKERRGGIIEQEAHLSKPSCPSVNNVASESNPKS